MAQVKNEEEKKKNTTKKVTKKATTAEIKDKRLQIKVIVHLKQEQKIK